MSTQGQSATINQALVYLPALILFRLAFSPSFQCHASIQESLKTQGWLTDYPAEMRVSPGNYVRIDGRHRLGYLNSINRLDLQVPTRVILT